MFAEHLHELIFRDTFPPPGKDLSKSGWNSSCGRQLNHTIFSILKKAKIARDARTDIPPEEAQDPLDHPYFSESGFKDIFARIFSSNCPRQPNDDSLLIVPWTTPSDRFAYPGLMVVFEYEQSFRPANRDQPLINVTDIPFTPVLNITNIRDKFWMNMTSYNFIGESGNFVESNLGNTMILKFLIDFSKERRGDNWTTWCKSIMINAYDHVIGDRLRVCDFFDTPSKFTDYGKALFTKYVLSEEESDRDVFYKACKFQFQPDCETIARISDGMDRKMLGNKMEGMSFGLSQRSAIFLARCRGQYNKYREECARLKSLGKKSMPKVMDFNADFYVEMGAQI